MSVVLVGATGWLGSTIAQRMGSFVAVPASRVLETEGRVLEPVLTSGAVVVNAAGTRRGDAEAMDRLNTELPSILATWVVRTTGHLVHLGSAAEYGPDQPDGICREDAEEVPASDYGRSKLAGTRAAEASGHATVLRVFNVAAPVPQEGSPLADVVGRLRSALADGRDVELLSARTARDWVTPRFVAASVQRAMERRPTGIFNLASGVGVLMGDAVSEALRRLGSSARVIDLGLHRPSVVVGAADRWWSVSGLREEIGVRELGAILRAAVVDRPEHDPEGMETR